MEALFFVPPYKNPEKAQKQVELRAQSQALAPLSYIHYPLMDILWENEEKVALSNEEVQKEKISKEDWTDPEHTE